MITAVDTNVLIDVFTADRVFGSGSREALRSCRAGGALIACDVVWAEVAAGFAEPAEAESALSELDVRFTPLGRDAATAAGAAWREYRRRSRRRDRVVADLLIGAHAAREADVLLTRDRGFYSRWFPNLEILDPSR